MFGFRLQRRVEKVEGILGDHIDRTMNEHISLARRIKLLEKHLGLTFSGGEKRKAHYKKTGKVGRPRKADDMPRQ